MSQRSMTWVLAVTTAIICLAAWSVSQQQTLSQCIQSNGSDSGIARCLSDHDVPCSMSHPGPVQDLWNDC